MQAELAKMTDTELLNRALDNDEQLKQLKTRLGHVKQQLLHTQQQSQQLRGINESLRSAAAQASSPAASQPEPNSLSRSNRNSSVSIAREYTASGALSSVVPRPLQTSLSRQGTLHREINGSTSV